MNHSVTELFVHYSGHHSVMGLLLAIQLPDVSDSQMPTTLPFKPVQVTQLYKRGNITEK